MDNETEQPGQHLEAEHELETDMPDEPLPAAVAGCGSPALPAGDDPPRATDAEVLQAVAEWYSTPRELRQHDHLAELARELGRVTPSGYVDSRFYTLAKDPKVGSQLLQSLAAGILPRAPAVLDALADAAEGGSARAADVFLRHLRELLTVSADQPRPHQHLHVHLEHVNELAGNLLRLADARPTVAATENPVAQADAVDVPDDHAVDRWADRTRAAVALEPADATDDDRLAVDPDAPP